mgnify:CR=1 FL=1
MSIVLSRPAILVLISRFGFLASCALTLPVTKLINWRWRYSIYLRIYVALSFCILFRLILNIFGCWFWVVKDYWLFLIFAPLPKSYESWFLWYSSSMNCSPVLINGLLLTMQMYIRFPFLMKAQSNIPLDSHRTLFDCSLSATTTKKL